MQRVVDGVVVGLVVLMCRVDVDAVVQPSRLLHARIMRVLK